MDAFNFTGYEGSVELDRERGVCRGKLLSITDLVTYEAGPCPSCARNSRLRSTITLKPVARWDARRSRRTSHSTAISTRPRPDAASFPVTIPRPRCPVTTLAGAVSVPL